MPDLLGDDPVGWPSTSSTTNLYIDLPERRVTGLVSRARMEEVEDLRDEEPRKVGSGTHERSGESDSDAGQEAGGEHTWPKNPLKSEEIPEKERDGGGEAGKAKDLEEVKKPDQPGQRLEDY